MTEDVILLAGLPGCGKTTLLCQMCRDGWSVFDDFKADAHDNSSVFNKSRKFRALVSALHDGLKCAVADIDFCTAESREEAVSVLLAEVPGVMVGWRFFENCPSTCEANIRNRHRASLREDLEKLHKYSALDCIPQGGPEGIGSGRPP
jgi:GTPase SAR1 family protein